MVKDESATIETEEQSALQGEGTSSENSALVSSLFQRSGKSVEVSPPKGVGGLRRVEYPQDEKVVERTADVTYQMLREFVERQMHRPQENQENPHTFSPEEEAVMNAWSRQMEIALTQNIGLIFTEQAVKKAMAYRQADAETDPALTAAGDAIALLSAFDRVETQQWAYSTLQTLAVIRTGVNRMLSVMEIGDIDTGESRKINPDERELLLRQLDTIFLEKLTDASILQIFGNESKVKGMISEAELGSTGTDRMVQFLRTGQYVYDKTVELEHTLKTSGGTPESKKGAETVHRLQTAAELRSMLELSLQSMAAYNSKEHPGGLVIDSRLVKLHEILSDTTLDPNNRQNAAEAYLKNLQMAGDIPKISTVDPRQIFYSNNEDGLADLIPLNARIKGAYKTPPGFGISAGIAEKLRAGEYKVPQWEFENADEKEKINHETMFMFVFNNLPRESVWFETILENEENLKTFIKDFREFMDTPRVKQVMALIHYINRQYQLSADQNPQLELPNIGYDTAQRIFALQVGATFLKLELGEQNKFGLPPWEEFCRDAPATAQYSENDPRYKIMEASDMLDRAMGRLFLDRPDREKVIETDQEAVNAIFLSYSALVDSVRKADNSAALHKNDPSWRNVVRTSLDIPPYI